LSELTETDIVMVRSLVADRLAARSQRRATVTTGQPMLSEAMLLIASQAVLPILVAVTSGQIQEFLKNRRLRSLSRTESEDLAQDIAGRSLAPDVELPSAERTELRQLLGPLGFDDRALDQLVEEVSARLARRPD
jgi:hypothetical protein